MSDSEEPKGYWVRFTRIVFWWWFILWPPKEEEGDDDIPWWIVGVLSAIAFFYIAFGESPRSSNPISSSEANTNPVGQRIDQPDQPQNSVDVVPLANDNEIDVNPENGESAYAIITGEDVNVRSGPGAENPVITQVSNIAVRIDTESTDYSPEAEWIPIILSDNTKGFINSAYVNPI